MSEKKNCCDVSGDRKEAVSDDFLKRFGIGWWATAGGQVFANMTQEKLKELESYVNDLEKRLDLFKGANNSARVRLSYVEAELAALKCCGNCRHWTRPSIFEATVCALVNDGDDRVSGDHVCDQWMHRILEGGMKMESLMMRVSRDPGWAIEEIVRLRTEAEKAEAELEMFRESLALCEAELAALKKDRILEATKEKP